MLGHPHRTSVRPDPNAVNSMFCRIARRYDLANRLLSGGADIWWRRQLVNSVQRTGAREVMDLATGSGDVAFALGDRLPGVKVVGVDFCQPMLDQAEQKKSAAGANRFSNVSFRQGDGLALPFPNESFNAVTMSFGLRNMADRHRCLTEIRRVLKADGKLFVLEFSQPCSWFRPLYLFYLRKILPGLAGAVTGDRAAYVYLNETIEQFPNASELTAEIEKSRFTGVQARPLSFGIVALHVGTK